MQLHNFPFNVPAASLVPTFEKVTIGLTLMKQISAPSPDRVGCIE